jgi:GT2 family glycosyltransferase
LSEAHFVSLIVATRNRHALLRESIESVLAGDKLPAEIVIVDQSEEPDLAIETLPEFQGCVIRLVRTNSIGLSRANAVGIASAAHDVLAFTHDDVLVEPTWFGELVRALAAAGERSVVTGRVLPAPPEEVEGIVTLADGRIVESRDIDSIRVDEEPALFEGRVGKNVLAIVNMIARRRDLDAVGGFDERLGSGTRFPGGDDSDLGLRLLEAGFRIVYAPAAVLYHRAWRPGSRRRAIRWGYARGQGAFYAKHLSLRDRYMLRRLWHELSRRTIEGTRTARHEPRRAVDQVVSIGGVLSGVVDWLIFEQGKRSSRRRSFKRPRA